MGVCSLGMKVDDAKLLMVQDNRRSPGGSADFEGLGSESREPLETVTILHLSGCATTSP